MPQIFFLTCAVFVTQWEFTECRSATILDNMYWLAHW